MTAPDTLDIVTEYLYENYQPYHASEILQSRAVMDIFLSPKLDPAKIPSILDQTARLLDLPKKVVS